MLAVVGGQWLFLAIFCAKVIHMQPTTTTWVTIARAASLIGISPAAAEQLAETGALVSAHINGKVRVLDTSVASYLERDQ